MNTTLAATPLVLGVTAKVAISCYNVVIFTIGFLGNLLVLFCSIRHGMCVLQAWYVMQTVFYMVCVFYRVCDLCVDG